MIGAVLDSSAPEATPAEAALPPEALADALDAAVARAVPLTAVFLGAVYGVLTLSHPFVVPAHAAPWLTGLAASSGVGLLGLWLALRRRPVPFGWGHRLMAAIGLVVLVNSTTHLALVPEPRQTTNFLILLAACGFLLLSRPWLAVGLVATAGSWVVLALAAPPDPAWIHFAYAIGFVTVLSTVVHEVRVRNTSRLIALVRLAEGRAHELVVRRRVESELRAREVRLARFNVVLLQLAKSRAIVEGNLESAFTQITETAAASLDVARVGIFLFDTERTKIVSADVLDRRTGDHSRGLELESIQYPRYFSALEQERALAVADALHDPRTSEFVEGYLAPLGITSMLDAPVRFRGETAGVVCHEHVGSTRRWAPEEEVFAASIADFVALALEARDRHALEGRMQEVQRLESLGILAGGIAHDFNNLLAAILGHADLALMDLAPEAPVRGRVERIRKAGRRAAELTHQMLVYSGRAPVDVRTVDLSELVEEMAGLLESSIRKSARLRCELARDLPAVQADVAQLRQIVMNLITNASDALGDSDGEILVRTGTARVDQAYLAGCELREGIEEGSYVFLEVFDSGCGMDAPTRTRIFDPFFTTKTTGRGLGLAAALGIVAAHGGTIRLRTAPGQGTTFRVLLPRAGGRPVARLRRAPVAQPTSVPQPLGTLLVVDDEEDVRRVAVDLLERAGFRALEAANGNEAVAVFRRHAADIALALVDLTMPEGDGVQVAHALGGIRPDVPVVLASGYDKTDALSRVGSARIAGFVHKPFEADELVAVVRSALRDASQLARTSPAG